MDFRKGQRVRVSFETEITWVYSDKDIEVKIPGDHRGDFWFNANRDAKVEILEPED